MTDITFWGAIASPYQLKMQSLADYAGCQWQRWPDQTNSLKAIGAALRLNLARRKQSVARYPGRDAQLDEYPTVPYYTLDGRSFFYDSTGLALHLDQLNSGPQPLLPKDPALRFICQLIDEAYDEFGLYMVHHNRWVTSAATNCMGEVTSREMRKVLPPGLRQRMARTLPQRQVRRCPYLFSVAPDGFDAGVSQQLTPPARPGFPPTHDILNSAWRSYLSAMETVLQNQPYLLGERFSLADASAYGQLSMNLIDGRAAELIEQLAPTTYRWLCDIRDGKHIGSTGDLFLSEHLQPLLEIIAETFSALMRQNQAAYHQALTQGQSLFNEAAFDRGEALYDGTLMDQPFRAVVKTFQVVVWRDVCTSWQQLEDAERKAVQSRYPVVADTQFTTTG
jgi:glutathione S-transferase